MLDSIRPDMESMKSGDRHVVMHGEWYNLHTHKQFSEKRTYAKQIADAPEEEDEILARILTQMERKNIHGSSAKKYITKGRRH